MRIFSLSKVIQISCLALVFAGTALGDGAPSSNDSEGEPALTAVQQLDSKCSAENFKRNVWVLDIDSNDFTTRDSLFEILRVMSLPGFNVNTKTMTKADTKSVKLYLSFSDKAFKSKTDAEKVRVAGLEALLAIVDINDLSCVEDENSRGESMKADVGPNAAYEMDIGSVEGVVGGSNGTCKVIDDNSIIDDIDNIDWIKDLY